MVRANPRTDSTVQAATVIAMSPWPRGLKLRAALRFFDKHEVRPGRAEAESDDLPKFPRIVKLRSARLGRKLDDGEPRWMPFALEDSDLATANQVASAVFLEQPGHRARVRIEARSVVNVEIDHEVRRHG